MTPRTLDRMRHLAASVLLVGGLVALVGCDPRPFFYFLQPFEPTIPAPGPSLQGKKVVVLTHATSGSQAEFPTLERELNREFVANLRKKAKKITVVDPTSKQIIWQQSTSTGIFSVQGSMAFSYDHVLYVPAGTYQSRATYTLSVP